VSFELILIGVVFVQHYENLQLEVEQRLLQLRSAQMTLKSERLEEAYRLAKFQQLARKFSSTSAEMVENEQVLIDSLLRQITDWRASRIQGLTNADDFETYSQVKHDKILEFGDFTIPILNGMEYKPIITLYFPFYRPNIVITRDILQKKETLESFVTRQKESMLRSTGFAEFMINRRNAFKSWASIQTDLCIDSGFGRAVIQ